MSVPEALQAIAAFQGKSLSDSLSEIEAAVVGLDGEALRSFCLDRSIGPAFMLSAAAIKQVAGQINTIIHAAGIVCSLPALLMPGETVERVSLGAGNTGRKFDLETSHRVAEYKFIDWRGGAESIRQDSLFKDFFELAEHETHKSRHLYVVGTQLPLKFLRSRRAITSVLGRNPDSLQRIRALYGSTVSVVRDYYELKRNVVEIADVSPYIAPAK
jgi:hypothetical protein